MNISRNWLKEFVDIEATDREYDEIMTIAGQKVETTTRMDAEIKNVVVGKVLSMARHENSDHMWVCMVDVGAEQPVHCQAVQSPGDEPFHFRCHGFSPFRSRMLRCPPVPAPLPDTPAGVRRQRRFLPSCPRR